MRKAMARSSRCMRVCDRQRAISVMAHSAQSPVHSPAPPRREKEMSEPGKEDLKIRLSAPSSCRRTQSKRDGFCAASRRERAPATAWRTKPSGLTQSLALAHRCVVKDSGRRDCRVCVRHSKPPLRSSRSRSPARSWARMMATRMSLSCNRQTTVRLPAASCLPRAAIPRTPRGRRGVALG